MKTSGLQASPVTVEVNGRALGPSGGVSLGEILVSQKLSYPSQCELRFFNEPGPAVISVLVPGAALRVLVGASQTPLFNGEVTAVEHIYEPNQGRRLFVRGYDRLHRLNKRQPVRAHVDTNLGELAREMAEQVGLSVQPPPRSLSWRRLIQDGQTDLDFLAQLADMCGLYLTLRNETLHLITLEGMGDPVPLPLGPALLEARIEVNGDPACRVVTASGWNPLRAEQHQGRATQARTGRSVSTEIPPQTIGGTPERTFVHQTVQDDSHAEAIAQAELDLRAAREVVLRAVSVGDPRLQPGARVDVTGVAPAVSGRYVLTEITHRLGSEHGFISQISTYPVSSPPRPGSTSIALGKVTSIDDPEKLGRVQVSLPACNGVETDWMGVVTVGAGSKKGLIMLPDVGDTVLVLCAQADAANGIVLGGLYGVEGPPDGGIENRAVKRFTCVTPGGQILRFDDAKQSVRVENARGSFVEMTPDKFILNASADLEIRASGKTITLLGNAIDFQQG